MKKKFIQKNIFLALVLTIVLSMLGKNAYAENVQKRIYGEDRIKTSIEVSKSGWEKGADCAVIAQGYDYADALCASPLAKQFNAPILLTDKIKLSNGTIEELKRLNVKKVFIVGGSKVVSDKVENQLKDISVKDVERLCGSTRYDTALKVASKFPKVDTIFMTSGSGYADSLSVASIAAKKGAPILFSEKDNIKPSVKEYIKKNNISKVYAIGGKSLISDNALKGISSVERIYGKDRYETNKKIMQKFVNELDFGNVYFVKGNGPKGNEFADALSISPLAAIKSAPVILTYKGIDEGLNKFLKTQITSRTNLVAIGGEKVVPSSILKNVSTDLEVIEISKAGTVPAPGTTPSQNNVESTFRLVVSVKNSTDVDKQIKIEIGKSAMDYLKSCASVNESNGFINSINSVCGKKTGELTQEQKQRGILGEDWFVYLNGSKTSVGANEVFPNKGDTLSFKFREWDKSEYNMNPGETGAGTTPTPTPAPSESGHKENILKQVDGNVSLIISKLEGNKVKIQANSKNDNSNIVNIVLYDEKGALVYIGQANLISGKCEFNTVLESGKYHGYYKGNGTEKIEISKFQAN